MELKYKDSWPEIIEIAKSQTLDFNQSILLLAVLEIEDDEGWAPHKIEAKGSASIGERAKAYAKWLRNRDFHYQNYLKRLEDKEGYDFIEYVMGNKAWDIKDCMKLIESQFTIKETAK